jgi:hypothetical protein
MLKKTQKYMYKFCLFYIHVDISIIVHVAFLE